MVRSKVIGSLGVVVDGLTAAGLTKRYGHHRALASVDLEVGAGSVCAVLGPNGAGKSTLLGILSTLVRPTSGEVRYRSGDDAVAGGPELRAQFGVLAHQSFIYGQLTAIENLRFYGRLYKVAGLTDRIELLLDRVGLENAARTRAASTYSRGMLQRLALARTLLHDPRVLFLDEPFTGLDRLGAAALGETLAAAKDHGRLVVVVTHDFEPIGGLADQLIILRRGKIAYAATRGGGFSAAQLKELYHEHSE